MDTFNPITETSARIADMPTRRLAAAAGLVEDKIFVLGGMDRFGTNPGSKANEYYDPVTNTWSVRTNLPRGRWAHSAAVVGEKIYVFGERAGSEDLQLRDFLDAVDVYTPAIDSWTTLGNPMPRRPGFAAAVAIAGRTLLFGGMNKDEEFISAIDEFDPATRAWHQREPMPFPRRELAVAALDDLVYVTGGSGRNGPSRMAQTYDRSRDRTLQ